MTRTFKRIAFTIFFYINTVLSITYAQWVHSGGPEGGSIGELYFGQGRLFAHINYYSDDLADNWQTYTTKPFAEGPIASFLESDSRILLSGDDKIFASTNKGVSWVQKMSGLPSDISVPRIFKNASTLYVSSYHGKLFKSTNNGDNWSEITHNLGQATIESMVFVNNTLIAYAPNFFVGTYAVYYSSDPNTWTKSNFPSEWVLSMVAHNGKIYIISNNKGLYISSDSGKTFTLVNANVKEGKLSIINGQIFYTSGKTGVYVISEDGKTLTPKNGGLVGGASSIVIGNNALFVIGSQGVYRSGDNGNNWTLANKGLGYKLISSMTSLGDTLFAGTESGVWRSFSYGLRWIPVGQHNSLISSLVQHNGVIYALAYATGTNTLSAYKSADLGVNWEAAGNGFPNAFRGKLTVFKNNLILTVGTASSGGVYKLTNFTGAWTKIFDKGYDVWASNDYLYVGGKRQRSSDLTNWENLNGLDDAVIYFSKDSKYYYAGGIHRTICCRSIYRSSDGINFSEYTSGLPNLDVIDLITRDNTTYLAAMKLKSLSPLDTYMDTYLYKLDQDATSWTYSTSIAGVIEGSFLNTKRSLLYGTQTHNLGIYRYNFQAIPSVPDNVDRITYTPLNVNTTPSAINSPEASKGIAFTLFPNPSSNGEFTIEGKSLIKEKEVALEIINSMGSVLLKDAVALDLDGSFKVNSQSKNISVTKGIYIIKLQTSSGTVSQKLLIE